MEINKLVAELVMRFDFEYADPDRDWDVVADWLVVPSNLQVKVKKRTSDETL